MGNGNVANEDVDADILEEGATYRSSEYLHQLFSSIVTPLAVVR